MKMQQLSAMTSPLPVFQGNQTTKSMATPRLRNVGIAWNRDTLKSPMRTFTLEVLIFAASHCPHSASFEDHMRFANTLCTCWHMTTWWHPMNPIVLSRVAFAISDLL